MNKQYNFCIWCMDGCKVGKRFCEDCEICSVPELMTQIEDLKVENANLKSQIEKLEESRSNSN
jgi:uncharacterized small protein (DUF1192 family)